MTRHPSPYAAFTVSVLALAACADNPTEPEATRPLPSTVPASAVTSNSWITRADMPRLRREFATAAVRNLAGESILYAIGGYNPSGATVNTVQAYNVATNKWTIRAPLPARVWSPNGAGVIKGKIYVSGGIMPGRVGSEGLYMYDPATDTWTQKKSMPSAGFSGVTGVINDQLYVLTGCTGYSADCEPVVFLAFYRYDPATDQWAILPTPTSPHIRAMGGVIGGKFYVAGGDGSGGKVEAYDPATNQWTTKASMPRERVLGAGVALAGKLYVIGGVRRNPDGSTEIVRTTNVYDPTTDTWTFKAPMPTARHAIGGVRVVRDGQPRIEVVGGGSPGNNIQYVP